MRAERKALEREKEGRKEGSTEEKRRGGKDDHDNADIAETDGRGRVASGRVIKHRL